MLTRPGRTVVATRPAYRPFGVRVARVLRLAPHLVRVTFTGPDLGVFGDVGLDQRVKLLLPGAAGLPDIGQTDAATLAEGTWYTRWRALPDEQRGVLRTYTVRAVRQGSREIDVDMVDHDPGPQDGPAVRWLRSARVGDRIVVVGPDARSTEVAGVDWHPGTARHLLLVGDETAAPAICSIVESLRTGTAQAFVEVPTADDILTVYPAGSSRITWLARDAGRTTAGGARAAGVGPADGGPAQHGALLTAAVRRWLARSTTTMASVLGVPEALEDVDVDRDVLWDVPPDPSEGDFYAWVAGEAAMVRGLRRLLVGEVGVPRTHAAFMGYWRQGRPEPS